MTPLLRGKLTVDVSQVDDHYSLMEHLRKEVKKQWKIKEDEWWDIIQEYMMECPDSMVWECYKVSE